MQSHLKLNFIKRLVDGGWGSWGAWDQCSVSCGVGIQHRERQCNNPTPSLFGQHCFGHDIDDRICYNRPCSGGQMFNSSLNNY